ncbi:CNH domain-containing protein [Dactylonectria macrodidyma]|uniref:CNH domain-containing protein n=1 Tax=Dactylonectria macrodidyma TaxID=307937 RepID=A0A9P9EXQ1_9HYPO|nr:CNH domain-containing protein [Dactylonectria macrodidyma]
MVPDLRNKPAQRAVERIAKDVTYFTTTKMKERLLLFYERTARFVPNLSPPELAGLANRIRNQRPLEMFRLSAREFIIAYDKCAVFMDEHGNISRSLILDYTVTQAAHGAIMHNKYLLLFYDDYVEVRDPENERFRQIIPGHDIRVLDYGVRGPRSDISLNPQGAASASSDNNGLRGTVKIAMNHPELAGRRLILEMLLNDR